MTVPFENLSLHYSESHNIDIDPQVLWDKVIGRGLREQAKDEGTETIGHVDSEAGEEADSSQKTAHNRRKWQAGRGGYCMENNCFFGTILRSIGSVSYTHLTLPTKRIV